MAENTLLLYAEDDENDAFFMRRAFTRLNRADALRIVENGRRVIDYLTGRAEFADRGKYPLPTLLMLDVKMPEMSGLDVLRWVRTNPSFARLPVVMFTSSTQDSDVTFSRTHGANAYLVKPANANMLAVLIEELLAAAARLPSPEAPLAVSGNQVPGASR